MGRMDSQALLAGAIIFAVLIAGWMFRYENQANGVRHRNRFTGAVCLVRNECWFSSDQFMFP